MTEQLNYKELAKAINRKPGYVRVLLSRRRISITDTAAIDLLLKEYEFRNKHGNQSVYRRLTPEEAEILEEASANGADDLLEVLENC